MFGDNFYAEFKVETVYNGGDFPNTLLLTLGEDSYLNIADKDINFIFAILINQDSSMMHKCIIFAPDGTDSTMWNYAEYPFTTGNYRTEGNLKITNFGNNYTIQIKNETPNSKYAYGIGYDATAKEFVVYFYSFNGNSYNYEGLCRFDFSKVTGLDEGNKFYLDCEDSNNPESPTDAPCVSVKANFGSEEFLFPDIAEPYQYEMKELHLTENPDIDVYINDKGPKTGTVKVRKGSDVKIEAKAKDISLQDYVRIYVTPES